MRILGLAASLRSRFNIDTVEMVRELSSSSYEDTQAVIDRECRKQKLSNSDAMLAFALWGAARSGLEIDGLSVRYGTLRKSNNPEADGYILSTPVYFGDYSSLAKEVFQKDCDILKGSVFGTCSVGAKRNGGQETTNIFAMRSALDCGMYVVGNGPRTSQYGGTAVAGDFGSVRSDDVGIETAVGVGANVARVCKLFENPIVASPSQITTCNFDNNFTPENMDIKPCMACAWCPGDYEEEYKCRIRDDDFRNVFDLMIRADSMSVNVVDTYKWRIFLERMRCIRRDNLKLAYKPVYDRSTFGFVKWLRQDMIICPRSPSLDTIATLSHNRNKLGKYKLTYTPVGYGEDGVLPRSDLKNA